MIDVYLKEMIKPERDHSSHKEILSEATIDNRKRNVLNLMEKEQIDTLLIYADLEHGSNFYYLTGFLPRFEEGVLILHRDGTAFLMLGNENLKLQPHSRIQAERLHCPFFSLPNQPMDNEEEIGKLFRKAGLNYGMRVGIVGWKLFNSISYENRLLFDVPHYIVEEIKDVIGEINLVNRTDLFIHPCYGVRATNNANEIAFYEYGSSLASDCVLSTIDSIKVGKTELEIADKLLKNGELPSVVPIFSTGDRFENANIYPSNKTVKEGDKISITTGFKGGLASRSGYAVQSESELPKNQSDYIEKVAGPYFKAIVCWLENIKIGQTGSELYKLIETILPKSLYNWHLNPGHLTADEEWMSSPIFKNSSIEIKSGMILQLDIIPSVDGYAGAGCENGVAIADELLRKNIKERYPNFYNRIKKRQKYIREVLNIDLPKSVIPLSSGVGYYSPFLLKSNRAFVKSTIQ